MSVKFLAQRNSVLPLTGFELMPLAIISLLVRHGHNFFENVTGQHKKTFEKKTYKHSFGIMFHLDKLN
jgi:hypothetical protein